MSRTCFKRLCLATAAWKDKKWWNILHVYKWKEYLHNKTIKLTRIYELVLKLCIKKYVIIISQQNTRVKDGGVLEIASIFNHPCRTRQESNSLYFFFFFLNLCWPLINPCNARYFAYWIYHSSDQEARALRCSYKEAFLNCACRKVTKESENPDCDHGASRKFVFLYVLDFILFWNSFKRMTFGIKFLCVDLLTVRTSSTRSEGDDKVLNVSLGIVWYTSLWPVYIIIIC